MRNTSLIMRQAINAQETGEVFIVLISISHSTLSETIRVSSDAVDTISRGNTYIHYPFDIVLASDTENGPQTMRLSIDNIDRSIVNAVRSVSSPLNVTVEVVLFSDPDTVEVSFDNFKLYDVSFDSFVVSGSISAKYLMSEPYPGGTMLPSNFPGVF